MACLPRAKAALLSCMLLFLFLTICLCQRDCTGVDCPLLDNCIEEVLERGACCASCLQRGCTCEGYQYYDCIQAGFKNGKVPEKDSYFVDYGSTECSCPAGGGRISCHFISCPDIPPNCIEVLEPADGCMQCERIGCVHSGQKYEAGHSFHIDPCRVCHCPNEGGKLMCYPVPDCDPKKVHKPMLAASTEEDTVVRHGPYTLDQQDHNNQFPTMYHLSPNVNVPLLKSPSLDNEDQEDYIYGATDFPETYPQSPLFPTQSSSSRKVISVFRGSDRPEQVQDHPADKHGVTENPQSTVRPHIYEDTTTLQSQSLTGERSVSFGDQSPWTYSENPLHAHRSLGSATLPLNQGLGYEKHTKYPHVNSESAVHHSVTLAHPQNASDSVLSRESNSQIHVSHKVEGAEGQPYQQSQSEPNSHKRLQGTVVPDSEEEVDADTIEGGGRKEKIVTFQTVTEFEGKDVPYKIKSAQQEKRDKQSESSNPYSSYQKTTPSTSSPRGLEYHTTPVVPFTETATTTPPPVRVNINDSKPSRKPSEMLFNLHNKDTEEVEEEVMEKEEDNDHPVLHMKPDGGESQHAL